MKEEINDKGKKKERKKTRYSFHVLDDQKKKKRENENNEKRESKVNKINNR